MRKTRYTLDSGRCILRNGVAVATIHGVSGRTGRYAIGSPADLDDFAYAIVDSLNYREIAHEQIEENFKQARREAHERLTDE